MLHNSGSLTSTTQEMRRGSPRSMNDNNNNDTARASGDDEVVNVAHSRSAALYDSTEELDMRYTSGASTGSAVNGNGIRKLRHSPHTAPGVRQHVFEAEDRNTIAERDGGGRGGDGTVIDVGDSAEPDDSLIARFRHFVMNNDPLLFATLKWGLTVLLLLFLVFMVFGMLYSGAHYSTSCTTVAYGSGCEGGPGWCLTPFGTILGVFEDTYAYSNCNEECVSISDAYINLTVATSSSATDTVALESKEFYSGLAWQCVEYARRYWLINGKPQPAYFGAVDTAGDIWNLTVVHLVANTTATLPLHRYKNGDRVGQDGIQVPEAGDLIIYPIQPGGFPAGHVAVITKVDMQEHGHVYVAEQNWASAQWPGPFHNYSRRIPLHYDARTTAITITDPGGAIAGWMRYG